MPNRAARTLATRQTNAIALVVPEDTTRFFGDPFFAAIVSGINARMSRSDSVLNLFIASDDPGDKMTRYLTAGNVDFQPQLEARLPARTHQVLECAVAQVGCFWGT